MAGNKYHINPQTGRPNQCTATVRGCKYAVNNMVPEHYDSKEEAQAAYEKQMDEKKGQTSTLRKTKKPVKRKPNIGVHAAHCCSDHGCKYHNDECPVVNGQIAATYPCEFCQQESPMEKGYRHFLKDSGQYIDEETYEQIYYTYEDSMLEYGDRFNIDKYSKSIEYNEGEWYYPTPDERYHSSDISYTTNPSFTVKSEYGFAQDTILENLKHDGPYRIHRISDEGIEKLSKAGYFDTDSYEAKISWNYYGDEFDGWKLDENVKKEVAAILTEEAILQNLNIR